MKKQFQILAATFITIALISCSKEKVEPEHPVVSEEIASRKGGGNFGQNLSKGLEALYRFDGNLIEATGKLADGVPTLSTAVLYTADRYGAPNNAILFTGRFGVKILNVPCQPSMSVATWIKYSNNPSPLFHVVNGGSAGPTLSHENDKYLGVISTPATTSVTSPPIDNKWHHLVATYDGTNLRFYVDGNLAGTSFNPVVPWGGSFFPYYLSYFPGSNIMWQGSMDELRFYSRVLSASDVQALYNF